MNQRLPSGLCHHYSQCSILHIQKLKCQVNLIVTFISIITRKCICTCPANCSHSYTTIKKILRMHVVVNTGTNSLSAGSTLAEYLLLSVEMSNSVNHCINKVLYYSIVSYIHCSIVSYSIIHRHSQKFSQYIVLAGRQE